MITENNTVTAEYRVTAESVKERIKTPYICCILLIILGSAGLLAYIAVSVTYEALYEYSPGWCEFLLLFAVPFGFGLVFTLMFASVIKKAVRNGEEIFRYEFYSDLFTVGIYRCGEQTGQFRLNYKKTLRVRENGKFIIFWYPENASVYCIDKSTLSDVELNTLRKLFNKKLQGGEEVKELSSFEKLSA